MGTFLGCCVIAATVWYVGRKIARAIFAAGVVLENIGARQYENWPSETEARKAFRE